MTLSKSRFQPYFCGQDPRCTDGNSLWALEQAKKNVLEYLPLVGVMEKYNSTLQLMEKVFPVLLKGIFKLYSEIEGRPLPNGMVNLNFLINIVFLTYLKDRPK